VTLSLVHEEKMINAREVAEWDGSPYNDN